MFDIPDFRELIYKVAIVLGAIIVIYGILPYISIEGYTGYHRIG